MSVLCNYVAVSYANSPVMTGGKGCIIVKYNTSTVGGFRKTIVIKPNADNASKSILHIKGYVTSSMKR